MPNSNKHFSPDHRKKLPVRQHPVLINLLDNNNKTQRRSLFSPSTNLAPLSSMYGSDFCYPSATEQQQQHEYDNLTFTQNSSQHYYDPFPILIDCQHCNRSIDRSLFRDMSCQVPSDEDDEKTIHETVQFKHRKTKRSSPLYVSPSSTPPLCRHPPMANSLLAPYHFRRKHSLSSYVALHNRSKSAPSASSSTSSSTSSRTKRFLDRKNKRLLPSLSPLPTDTTVPSFVSENVPDSSTQSTTALLRSIKTSIDAMRNRLKDIRRLSEVGMHC
jgi:hypothetical protein